MSDIYHGQWGDGGEDSFYISSKETHGCGLDDVDDGTKPYGEDWQQSNYHIGNYENHNKPFVRNLHYNNTSGATKTIYLKIWRSTHEWTNPKFVITASFLKFRIKDEG